MSDTNVSGLEALIKTAVDEAKAKDRLNSITYMKILYSAFHEMRQMRQWIDYRTPKGASAMARSAAKAEALIELVEIADCGVVGGFSEGYGYRNTNSLYRRWGFLFEKYRTKENRYPAEMEGVKEWFHPETAGLKDRK